jgi:hypothetical protein
MLGVYVTIPVKEHKAPPPDPTAQAIHDLQTSLHQAVDQLEALQQTVSLQNKRTAIVAVHHFGLWSSMRPEVADDVPGPPRLAPVPRP